MNRFSTFRRLPFSAFEFRCQETLTNGQSFAWQKIASVSTEENRNSNEYIIKSQWIGVLHDKIVHFQQFEECVEYRFFPSDEETQKSCDDAFENKLLYYLHSSVNLKELVKFWADKDEWFANVADKIQGMRLLRQPALECVISFICSSNNNIGRITKMINALREKYGTEIGVVEDAKFYSFPSLEQLERATVNELLDLGFGYRAKYVIKTISLIKDKGENWLHGLKSKPKDFVRRELQLLEGVGPKVADCIALFSMDQFEIVPVDVHVWNLTREHYAASLPAFKTLTGKAYEAISNFYLKFGPMCGWAHSFLFTADLKAFESRVKAEQNLTAPKSKKRKLNKIRL